ncbi:MAG: hypothetical protein HN742_39925 [Lentisphaerae bacterium]|nr:hypothetical protein [Lentisphaerota bacterium]MBT4817965.1 hypothetical protein [Lentisphaerota bacterium]MBT5611329.1 hypothetical protein [Lentisphaerota bacterium]MBT7058145.1 hypothetical protein [Lentisphaerota bacterium]MBT7848105.1 hypothetical protein [Lentisphaerota bacterium]
MTTISSTIENGRAYGFLWCTLIGFLAGRQSGAGLSFPVTMQGEENGQTYRLLDDHGLVWAWSRPTFSNTR